MVLEGVEFKFKLGLFNDSRIVLKSSFEIDWILTGSCGTYSSSSFFSFFSTLKQKKIKRFSDFPLTVSVSSFSCQTFGLIMPTKLPDVAPIIQSR